MIYSRSWMAWEEYNIFAVDSPEVIFQAPGWLPDPLYITGCDFILEGFVPGQANCRPLILHDPKGEWCMAQYLHTGATELPPSAPLSNRNLHRVVVIDGTTCTKAYKAHNPPIRHSRNDGDKFLLDTVSLPPSVWFCRSIEYAVDDAAPPPPAFSFGIGTFARVPSGPPAIGRSIRANYNGSNLGFRFTAPADGEITNVKFRVVTMYSPGYITFYLYSDNNGSPGLQIGNGSWPWYIGMHGTQEPQWKVGCGANVSKGALYWIVGVIDSTLAIDVDTCPAVADHGSGRADTITSIHSDNIQFNETWRLQVCAIARS